MLTRVFSNLDSILGSQSLPADEVVFVGQVRSSACASIGLHSRSASHIIMNQLEFFSNRRKQPELTLQDHDISFPCLFRGDLPRVCGSFFHGSLLLQHQRRKYQQWVIRILMLDGQMTFSGENVNRRKSQSTLHAQGIGKQDLSYV